MTFTSAARFTIVFVVTARLAAAQPPVRTVDAPKADASRSVTLSLAEYNRLLDLAGGPHPAPSIAPIAAIVDDADLRIHVDRDVVRGVFALNGEVFRSGATRVPLVSGATLTDGSAQGRTLPLLSDGVVQTAVLQGPGPFALTLDWGAPVSFTPGRASFTLPVPIAGTAHATVDIPGDQADVHVSNGVVTRRASGSGRTTVEVTLRPGAATDVWWSMRDSAPTAAAREVRYLADVFSLVTLGDSDARLASLVDVSIVSGEPRSLALRLPAGYELTGVSGSTLESSEARDGGVVLTLAEPAARRHQFLITLERPHQDGSFSLETGFPSLPDAQRERGEIAVEGTGTLDLGAAEANVLHRIDVRELNAALQSLARSPLLAAFRYQRTPAAAPAVLAMTVRRFGDAGVLAAVADLAVATTMVTTEGRALTEIALTVQNRAQPYLKVALPAGATIVSVEVAGQPAKPVVGADGTRVPLLRAGFRPNGPYNVSFVYMHAGTPFLRKGDLQMALPRIDMPIGIVEWEMFVPEQYDVRPIDGNVIDRLALDASGREKDSRRLRHAAAGRVFSDAVDSPDVAGLPNQIRGRVVDASGAVVPGATIMITDAAGVTQTATSDANGSYVLSNVTSGRATIRAYLSGYATAQRDLDFAGQPRRVDFTTRIGALAEAVTVTGDSPSAARSTVRDEAKAAAEPPSQNVINLQRRAAGVLPIRVDVPRAGTSHRFVKPLVVDQETTVSLRYKRR